MSSYDDDDDYRSDDVRSDASWPESDDDRELDLVPEINAFNRVGLPGSGLITKKPTTRLEQATQDPLDRFRRNVDAVARNLNNWDEVENIDEKSIDKMIIKAADLNSVEYKNPTAYVLGFLATEGGNVLSKEKFKYVINSVLPHAKSDSKSDDGVSVLPADVIRYSRLWQNL
jgi:hypothetical protein